jgi:hypothetical protein
VKFEHFGALNIISQWQGQLALVWLPEGFFLNEFSHCGDKKKIGILWNVLPNFRNC